MKKFRMLPTFVCCLILFCILLSACSLIDEDIDDTNDFDKSTLKARATNYNTKIYSSKTDGTYNYYLLHVGKIDNMFISEIGRLQYNGEPLTFTSETSDSYTVMSVLTDTIVKMADIGDKELKAAWAEEIGMGSFNLLGSISWSDPGIQSYSEQSTAESLIAYCDKTPQSKKFKFFRHSHGTYRYAVYGTCDIYLTITTSRNNSTLYDCTMSACAKTESYKIRHEFSKDAIFDPEISVKLSINNSFYKNLKYPKVDTNNKGDTLNSADLYYSKTVRTGSTTIYNRNNNVVDVVNFNFKLPYETLVNAAYGKVRIKLSVDIKEYRKNDDVLNGIALEGKDGNELYAWTRKHHTGDWQTYQIEKDFGINNFYLGNDGYQLRIKYFCDNRNYQDWYLGTVNLTIIAIQ